MDNISNTFNVAIVIEELYKVWKLYVNINTLKVFQRQFLQKQN
jgi:hypothetical protein